jgi:O-methyltransferase involved in polyketide biosynthesis
MLTFFCSGRSFRGSDYKVQTAVDRPFIVASAGSIAAYRAAVTAYNNSYIDDPYARIFARVTCQERLEEVLQKPPKQLARFAVRTRFFDAFVRDAIHNRGIRQVCRTFGCSI